jgi:hypothetical protein
MQPTKKDQPLADVLSDLGFALEFFRAVTRAVMDKGGTMEHMRRVVRAPSLQKRIADLVVPANVAGFGALREGEYLVYVGYDMPTDKDMLEAEFSKGCVLDLFYGENEWQKHASCAAIDRTPGQRVMLLKQFDRKIGADEAIAKIKELGCRPATHVELYAFQKANPDLQYKFGIVALGSFTLDLHGPCVAALGATDEWRSLTCCSGETRWRPGTRFLCVPEGSSAVDRPAARENL